MLILSNKNDKKLQNTAVTIGNFDGMHLGHQALIKTLVAKARADGLQSVVVTFEPQPLEFFAPDKAPSRLSTLDEKCQVLETLGVDAVYVLHFDAALAGQTAEAFIQHFLLQTLDVKALLIGRDFRFGRDRQGDVAMLQKQIFDVNVIDDELLDGMRISSTELREALTKSDFDLARQMLGRDYTMTGEIVRGQMLGRKLGFPTMNIAPNRLKLPLHGIYVCTVHGIDNTVYQGAASIGWRPSVGNSKAWLEVYVLDYEGDLYGKTLTVTFLKKIRDEEKFESLDELTMQIKKDVEETRAYFAIHKRG